MAAMVDSATAPPAVGATNTTITTVDGDDIIETNWSEQVNSFDSMGLKDELLRGIYAYGFEKPSVIQQRAVKPMMLQKDVIAQAQSGRYSLLYLLDMSFSCLHDNYYQTFIFFQKNLVLLGFIYFFFLNFLI